MVDSRVRNKVIHLSFCTNQTIGLSFIINNNINSERQIDNFDRCQFT